MKTLVLFLLLLNGFYIWMNSPVYPQDSIKIIILSDKIGPVLDSKEREYFHLFTRFKNFEQATFYQTADSQYYCRLSFNNDKPDSLIKSSFVLLKNMAIRIEYFERLKLGEKFEISDVPVTLKYESGVLVSDIKKNLASDNSSTSTAPYIKKRINTGPLPLNANPLIENFIIEKYKFGISVGILHNSCKYDGLAEIFNDYEDSIPEAPYEIPKSDYEFSTPVITRIGINFLYDQNYFGEVNYDFDIGANSINALDYESFSLTGGYLFPLPGAFRPYITAGYVVSTFSVKKDYGNQINEQNFKLGSITFNSAAAGIKFNAGTIISLSRVIHVNIFVSYNALGQAKMYSSGYNQPLSLIKVNQNSYDVGVNLFFQY